MDKARHRRAAMGSEPDLSSFSALYDRRTRPLGQSRDADSDRKRLYKAIRTGIRSILSAQFWRGSGRGTLGACFAANLSGRAASRQRGARSFSLPASRLRYSVRRARGEEPHRHDLCKVLPFLRDARRHDELTVKSAAVRRD